MKRIRVKCANCGMIYDVTKAEPGEVVWETGTCPKCNSNAYDKVTDYTPYYQKGYDIANNCNNKTR